MFYCVMVRCRMPYYATVLYAFYCVLPYHYFILTRPDDHVHKVATRQIVRSCKQDDIADLSLDWIRAVSEGRGDG